MEFKVGDRVRFLNEVGGGTITKVMINNLVKVMSQDGFEVPVQKTELILIEPVVLKEEKNIGSESKVETSITEELDEEMIEGNDSPLLFYAFVPTSEKEPLKSDIQEYLINDCNYTVLYNISTKVEGKQRSIASGKIAANTKEPVSKMNINEISGEYSLNFQFLFLQNNEYDYKPAMTKEISIKDVKFYKDNAFGENDFFYENAMLLTLIDDKFEQSLEKLNKESLNKLLKEKQESGVYEEQKKEKYSARKEDLVIEEDLHINALLDNVKGMSNTEILNFQMDHFHKTLKKAMEDKASKVIFIHGIGNGTLKSELRKSLETDYKNLKHQDASYKEYGYGATLVVL